MLDEVFRRNYFGLVDCRFTGLPLRRFDELFELAKPTPQQQVNHMWIEFIILWCRWWLYCALPEATMRNHVLGILQIALDAAEID